MSLSDYRSLLITGGTGSFGKAFVKRILNDYPNIERLVIFSRDELKQFEMSQEFGTDKNPGIRYFIGDIRDQSRLRRALEGIDVVVHAAALKQVPAAEYNPFEFIKTNIMGAQSLVEACLESDVKRVVALSTDKAAAPINLYGATKLASDKLISAANNIVGKRDLRFGIVRYGNVMGSRGSVIPFFLEKKKTGVLPITDPEMTRFNITLEDGVDLVVKTFEKTLGGEIFVPKIPSYRITDVAEAIGPECEHPVIGIRPGEKLHEEMITESDSFYTVDFGDHFAILSTSGSVPMDEYCKLSGATPVPSGMNYSSGNNDEFLTVEELRTLIKTHVAPDFEV
ncbi:MAG: UDP-N-acetylglucosamine 4,6-dehydratase (inverting) [Pseudomonadota bacterium]